MLAIGLMRYALLVAERLLPWLRRPVPPRHWRKVVAAVQGIALALVASGLLPSAMASLLLVVALALLVESFGRDVWWLWRQRSVAVLPEVVDRWPGTRVVVDRTFTVVACAVVWFALVVPNDLRTPDSRLVPADPGGGPAAASPWRWRAAASRRAWRPGWSASCWRCCSS